jgi:hypothetical protein
MNAFRAIASACLFTIATATSALAVDFEQLPKISDLPKGYVQVSPLIPMLGEHYDDEPVGTVPHGEGYAGYKGRIIAMEFLMTPEEFVQGKTWKNLRTEPSVQFPPVDHIDVDYDPQGHGAWHVPLYMLRVYYVSPEFLAAMKP